MLVTLIAGPGCASCVDDDAAGQPWAVEEPREQVAPLCEGFEARPTDSGWDDDGVWRDAPIDERLATDHYAGCDAIGLGYRYGSESDFEASTTRHVAPAPGLPPGVQQYMAETDADVAL